MAEVTLEFIAEQLRSLQRQVGALIELVTSHSHRFDRLESKLDSLSLRSHESDLELHLRIERLETRVSDLERK